MNLILRSVTYDVQKDRLRFDTNSINQFKNLNWIKYPKTKKRHLRKGMISHLQNYDQASYAELMYTPGSVLCNSYSPYEKVFALKLSNRFFSSKFVTKMSTKRLKQYAHSGHTPLNDFLAEYYFNLLQDEEKLIDTRSPEYLYQRFTRPNIQNLKYVSQIKMVRDGSELKKIVDYNDSVFKYGQYSKTPLKIVTPMVMSIEGAQVLYSTYSSTRDHLVRNPSEDRRIRWLWRKTLGSLKVDIEDPVDDSIHAELEKSVDSIRNLYHRLFFITLGHFARNQVVSFALTLDRDPENFLHRVLSFLSKTRYKDILNNKDYSGFNPVDSFGLNIAKRFLDPAGSKFKKPTYIDVKHMDIKARIQYYYMRRKYQKEFNIPIPIIASHFAVSGEGQALAVATGVWPHWDSYKEIEEIEDYYKEDVITGGKQSSAKYWIEEVMNESNKEDEKLYGFDRAVYRPLNFNNTDSLFKIPPFDPFANYGVNASSMGWFYPWSINLFDEEIIEINKSDGIIGLLMDPRQQGAYMKNYKKEYLHKVMASYDTVSAALFEKHTKIGGLESRNFDRYEYQKTEPLLRNIFYIVNLIRKQKDAESHVGDIAYLRKYPWFVNDTTTLKKDGWDMIAYGSDYDGLIDPVDYAPTASYLPITHRKFILYAFVFAQIHADEFFDPVTRQPLILSLEDSEQKMAKFFYENGKDFILKYF